MFKYFWGRKLEKDEAAQQAVKGHAVPFNPSPDIEGVVGGCLSPPTDEGVVTPIVDVVVLSEVVAPADLAVTPAIAKPYRVVLHEGSMRDGREASIQFWDDDFTFRVITKKHVLLFRSPCLNELIAYKKQHMRF